MWKRVLAILGSLIVSGLFLWLALRDVPLNEVLGSIQTANPLLVLAALVVGVLGIYTRAIRWRGLVDNRLSMSSSYYIVGIMQLMNLLPLRLGEVARAVLAARERLPIVTTASSIVVERLLDTVFVLAMLGVVVPQAEGLPPSVGQSMLVFSVLAVVAFVVLLVLARYPDFARNILHWFTTRIPLLTRLPLEKILDDILAGLKPLTHWDRFVHALVWTAVSWASSYLTFYLCQLALGVPANQLLFPALGLGLAAFGVAVPLTVAAVGPFEGAVIVAGNVFGVDTVVSTAMGFLVHGVSILMYIITGTWGFIGLGVALGDVLKNDDKTKTGESG